MGNKSICRRSVPRKVNIHGHKNFLKKIVRTIKRELEKKEPNRKRLKKLNLARIKHRDKIRELRKKKPETKRFFRKKKKRVVRVKK